MLLAYLLFADLFVFSKINIFTNFFQEYILSMSNNLDLVQVLCFVGPCLGLNCLQKLSADDTSRQR